MKKILIGGSPCTYWSIAQGADKREKEPEGIGWELFKNYLIAKEKFKPDFFLYENNKSASQQIKDKIQEELGGKLQYVNSALVSGQGRERFYVTNFEFSQPEDRGIRLQDVLESGMADRGKAYVIDANYWKGSNLDGYCRKKRRTMVFDTENKHPGSLHESCEVKEGIVIFKGKEYNINLPDGVYYPRKLSVVEAARLQTMPDHYYDAVSATQAYKQIGNGWTMEVIKHILSYANIPRDEEIVCLSMYDGVGTGRLVLKEMGYENVKYLAYEIDKYAIKTAKHNFPDIQEMGDAFQIREWRGELMY